MKGWLPQAIRIGAGGLLGVLVLASASLAAAAQRIPDDLAARLNDRQLKAYQGYLAARAPFDRRLDMYWAEVDSLRDGRRRKRSDEERKCEKSAQKAVWHQCKDSICAGSPPLPTDG